MSTATQIAPGRALKAVQGIGASEIALAMLSFGMTTAEEAASAPAWMRDRAEVMKRCGLPKWIAQKLGIAAQDPTSQGQKTGVDREPEVLAAWIERLEQDRWVIEEERAIDPSTIMWAGALPKEHPPHRDAESPIVCRPDAWARTWASKYVGVSIKAAHYGVNRVAWWNGIKEVPWYYRVQLDAEATTTHWTDHSWLLVGCGWNRIEDDPRPDGPLLALPVRHNRGRTALVREAAHRAMALITDTISRG